MTAEAKPSAVVFDFDGTLVDSMSVFLNVYTKAILALGGPDLTTADIVGAFHAGSSSEVLSHFLGRVATAADLECFYSFAVDAATSVRSFDGVPEMLSALAASDISVGLFTGATRRTTELLIESCGIAQQFAAVVTGDEVSRPKPAPEGLLLVCSHLGVPTRAVAYVGDSQLDVDCARAAGCLAVVALWGRGSGEVRDADAAAETPSAVLELVGVQAR